MKLYVDTSAVVPVLISEPTTPLCRRIWEDADRRITSRVTYIEAGAALAMAERRGRITADDHETAWANFVDIWRDVDVVELDADLAARAVRAASGLALRAYDSVHCAAAGELNGPDLVAAAGDQRLLDAWRSLGVAVIDTNQPG